MTKKQIDNLYNKLEIYIDNVELGPEHDPLLNQLTKLSTILDNLAEGEISKDSDKLMNSLDNKQLDTLINESINELNEFTSNINKASKLVVGIDKIINIAT